MHKNKKKEMEMVAKMTETQFLLALQKTKKSYKWQLRGNKIRGVARNGNDR